MVNYELLHELEKPKFSTPALQMRFQLSVGLTHKSLAKIGYSDSLARNIDVRAFPTAHIKDAHTWF